MPHSAETEVVKSPQRERFSVVDLLEGGDHLAHVLVAALLLLLALIVLIHSTYAFALELPRAISEHTVAESALTYLSGLLLGVIILELLSTILTYIKAHQLEATVKEFLIVALISSVRKILLVGAQSSLEKVTGMAFVNEAFGTVIGIAGILMLIGGLILLDYRAKRFRSAPDPALVE